MRVFEVGEVALSKDNPLSVDLKMFPDTPTATKVLFPKATSVNVLEVPESLAVQEVPFVEVIMVPDIPAPRKIPLA